MIASASRAAGPPGRFAHPVRSFPVPFHALEARAMHQSGLVFLQGGPDDLPPVWAAPPGGCGEPVKILRHNAYEHFEFTHEYCDLHGVTLPVYRWSYRTYIAE